MQQPGNWYTVQRLHGIILKNLKWQPIAYQAQVKVLMLTFKTLNSLQFNYFPDNLFHSEAARRFKSAGEGSGSFPQWCADKWKNIWSCRLQCSCGAVSHPNS